MPSIEATSIDSIIELIYELLSFQYEKDSDYNQAKTYLCNTIQFIEILHSQSRLTEINCDSKILLRI